MTSFEIPQAVRARWRRVYESGGRLVVLTGAGISAESGVPTFRGEEGYWTVGSAVYRPQEMATRAMFQKAPEAVWSWYLHRRGVCRAAEPNPGHRALVELERLFGERFRLVTQNVDGLHRRAGNAPDRVYEIHGNLDHARCADGCGQGRWRLDEALGVDRPRRNGLTDAERGALRCPGCGGWARPHILWFDESYDEPNYRYHAARAAAGSAQALVVVGTSGATNLPLQMGALAAEAGALILDVNLEPNPFSRLGESAGGASLRGPAATVLPMLREILPPR